MSLELEVPDPRRHPVPSGWWEQVALPAVESTDSWDALDEGEAKLRAFASYIEAFHGDALEFEKALRVVEKRRGELLGAEPTPGKPRPPASEVDESPRTQRKWRAIARHWRELYPIIRDATSRREVTQSALLRYIRGENTERKPEACNRRNCPLNSRPVSLV